MQPLKWETKNLLTQQKLKTEKVVTRQTSWLTKRY